MMKDLGSVTITIKSFRDLRVWQSAQDLCLNIYKLSRDFPKEERFGLTSQIRRASVSVPSNIAEGFGRRGAKEKDLFYHHALGSLFELDTQIELALKLRFIDQRPHKELLTEITQTQAMLIRLIQTNSKYINR